MTLDIPASGFVFLAIHIDYGLKATGNFQQNASEDAVLCDETTTVVIPDGQVYPFSVAGDAVDDADVSSANAFKNNPGVAGLPLRQAYSEPVEGCDVMLVKSSGQLLVGTAVTDEDGFFQITYRHLGPPTIYAVTLTEPGGGDPTSVDVTLKGNGFAHVTFMLLGGG